MENERYSAPAIVLHWAIATLVIALVVLGWWMQEIPKQPPGLRADAFNLHKSFGLAALAFIVALIAWRLSHSPPPLPPMPIWQMHLAKAMHLGLYVMVVAVAVSGYLGSARLGGEEWRPQGAHEHHPLLGIVAAHHRGARPRRSRGQAHLRQSRRTFSPNGMGRGSRRGGRYFRPSRRVTVSA